MQTMDEEPEPPMPNMVSITSDTTLVDVESYVELRPPGVCAPRVELVLRLAMMECHTWLGIGGCTGRVRRPRFLSREICLAQWPWTMAGPPTTCMRRRCGDHCRRLVGEAIKHSLRREEEYRRLTPECWDRAVPVGVERAVAVAALRRGGGTGGGTLEGVVDISVRFEFIYSEPEALLLACDEKDGGGITAGRRSGNGEAPSCYICFEEMSREADDVTELPGCTHSFHRCCIAAWFGEASTCPVCRRDQLHCLPPDYRDLHDKMAIYPDSLWIIRQFEELLEDAFRDHVDM